MGSRRLRQIDVFSVEHLVGGVELFLRLEGQQINLTPEIHQAVVEVINLVVDLRLPDSKIYHRRCVGVQGLLHRLHRLVIDSAIHLHFLQHCHHIGYVLLNGHRLLLLSRLVLRPKKILRKRRQRLEWRTPEPQANTTSDAISLLIRVSTALNTNCDELVYRWVFVLTSQG